MGAPISKAQVKAVTSPTPAIVLSRRTRLASEG
jgi:hypothetical protein